jgi:O-antigen biosynthesis protein
LAKAMRQAGAQTVHLIENALDAETLEIAPAVRAERAARPAPQNITIFFASGSEAHDADFEVATDALRDLLQSTPNVRVCIAGTVALPSGLADLSERIDWLPPSPFADYFHHLGRADIHIAPLERSQFNDAKSVIKYMEASMIAVPSICSPSGPISEVIVDGTNGFLADGPDQWRAALSALIGNQKRRERMGQAALATVQQRFSPDRILQTQVVPFVEAASRAFLMPSRTLNNS